jgi:hypothetical protein
VRKRLLLAVLVVVAFAVGYGSMTKAWPFFGRNQWYGYFMNIQDTAGTNILPRIYDGNVNALPNYIDSVPELASFIINLHYNGNTQTKRGADFIIDTMNGGPHVFPVSDANVTQWQSNLYYADSQGWISWFASFGHGYNSYYQGTGAGSNPADDAFYTDARTSTAVTFRGSGGFVLYAIRRECANPIGSNSFAPIQGINFTMSGRSTVSTPTAAPGATVTFNHYVRNDGPQGTSPNQIIWMAQQTSPTAVNLTPSTNSGTYTSGQEKNVVPNSNFVIPVGAASGTQYCQRVAINPHSTSDYADTFSTPACVTVAANFSLDPSIDVTVNGVTPTDLIAEVNDTLLFTFRVTNVGPGSSGSITCPIYGLVRNGPYTAPTPADSVSDAGYVPPATTCPQTFAVNTPSGTTIATQSVVVSAANLNRTICRSLYVTPATGSGGSASEEKCVRIVAKPYTRVFRGDVAVGGGLADSSGSCVNNPQAVIVGWNQRGATYAGAGAQYAVMALNQIFDFTSSIGNTAGGASKPQGLSFRNTVTDAANGNFGGNFGSLPCIPDHYATMPTSTSALPATVAAMTSNSYAGTGPVTLGGGGIVNPNNRISVYIDGDVYITSNITYSGTWSVGSIPMFRLIARGNIYIDNDVSQLDGLYVAQRNGSSGGIIYTCTTSAAPLVPTDPAFFAACDNSRLQVNGSLVAHQVQLGRTAGTVSQSTDSETAAGGNAGEAITYGPIMWIPQPTGTGAAAEYDAITTLPPIL